MMLKIGRWLARKNSPESRNPPRRRIDLGERPPRYPIYVIGDVHGCLDELLAAEERIQADIMARGRPGLVVLLGDYVDRGPRSAEVLDHLIAPNRHNLRRIALCGNHDELFLRFLQNPKRLWDWLELGGRQTLMSYGIDPQDLISRYGADGEALRSVLEHAVPQKHRQFLEELPITFRIGEYFFVHAGVRPGISLEEQSDQDLLWIRDPFLTEGPKLPYLVIHGHTPVQELEFGPGRIGIDTGAFFSGHLTVLKIDEGRATVV
ncbi:metallophosphoesterase family protein [Rhizobium sp. LC145]|jgi:serine/threonine protein phosphatase 1|uniref:metallophosphoesterase family protein n=1 Tax=Rhizobium sp. LC145 TaxID=1120688 RepID=UPI000A4C2997|nr:metallophosphoesterase family protein [Rhizobium sp. LC145]